MSKTYTVTQVNKYIKQSLENDFILNNISIVGEISNCTYHATGHIYFTIKESDSQMSAIMYSYYTQNLSIKLKEGMGVVVTGSINVYEKGGRYQIIAKKIEEVGKGDLYEKYLELKDKFEKAGMFDSKHKKVIPKFAQKIGIVTAKTGAAIRDIESISKKQNPYCKLVLYPSLVQGDNAKYSIVEGIKTLDKLNLDVIIVGRGGGSIEDLWAFNEEIVAKAIFDANTPIISAVGHETDFTISDFVADKRAATPSEAAVIANMDYNAFVDDLISFENNITYILKQKIQIYKHKSSQILFKLSLHSPKNKLKMYLAKVSEQRIILKNIISNKIIKNKQKVNLYKAKLNGLNPQTKLESGYAYICDVNNKKISSVFDINKDDELQIKLIDGCILASVKEVKNE